MGHSVGERQRWAWLAAAWSAVVASCLCGLNWVWVLLGGLLVSLYYIYMDRYSPEDGLAVRITVRMGKGGKLLIVLALAWGVVAMAWTATLADWAFPMVDGFPELGWVLLALTAWGIKKGAAACARCSGVLCLILLGLYGVVLVFALPDIQWEYLRPEGSWQQLIWTIGLCLMPAGVWYVPCQLERKGPAWKMAFLLPLFSGALAAVTVGVLSPELAAEEQVALYKLAQSVSLFGVVERIEPLLSAAMTMGVFSLLASLCGACQALADQIKPWAWNGVGACVAAAVLMLFVKTISWTLLAVGSVLIWLVLPLIVVWFDKRRT